MIHAHEDWFNFVINPKNLDSLLNTGSASDKQLLKYLRHFLDHSRQYDGKEQGSESQQWRVLLSLSAKILAQLHYRLGRTARKLPIALAHRLFLWLCACAGLPDPYSPPADNGLRPCARWLYQLYHRWALRCLVEENYVKKPLRSMVQGVAGITDRSTELHCAQSQEIAGHLMARVDRSLECLIGELDQQQRDGDGCVARPLPAAFLVPTLAEPEIEPDWSACEPVDNSYWRCLVHFELGQYYFMQRRYSQAFDHFVSAGPAASDEAMASFNEDPYSAEDSAEVPRQLLEAYLTAIRSVSRLLEARPALLRQLDACQAAAGGSCDGLGRLLVDEELAGFIGRGESSPVPDFYWDRMAEGVRTCRLVRQAATQAVSGEAAAASCGSMLLDYHRLLAAHGGRGLRFLLNAATAAAVGPNRSSCGGPGVDKRRQSLRRLLRHVLRRLKPAPAAADLAGWPWPEDNLLQEERQRLLGEHPDAGAGCDDADLDCGLDTDDDAEDADDAGPPAADDEAKAFHQEVEAATPGESADDLRLLYTYQPAEVASLVERLCRQHSWSPQSVAGLCQAWLPPTSRQQQAVQPLLHQPHHQRQQQLLAPVNTTTAATAAVLAGKASVLQRTEEFQLARRLLASQSQQQKQQQQYQLSLLLLDATSCLATGLPRPADLAPAVESALRQMQEGGGGSSGGFSEDLAVLGSCVLLAAGRLPPQFVGGGGGGGRHHQQATAANYCIDFARLLMLAAADRDSAATAASGAGSGLLAQKSPSHADLWARVGRFFVTLGGGKRTPAGAPAGNGGASAGSPAELGFARRCLHRLLRSLRSEQHVDLLLSLLAKLTCLACTDLNSPVHTSCPQLWPDQLPVRLPTALHRAVTRRALGELLDTAVRLQPANPSWLLTRADLAYAEREPSLALRCYLEAAIAATELFERPLPIQLFSDDAVRRMARCCELLGMRSCAGILAQSVPDQASAVRLLSDPSGGPDLSDCTLPYLWDLSLLEILTVSSARRGALAKRDKFVRAARAMELNSCNRPDWLHEVESAKKAEFLRALAGLLFGSI
uniref:EST1_DNA_bind domain-containing protein n=1 Tax=Macrostomum lignano TaxID=282301 RepID=A0A1I8HD78_9PLAT